MTHWGVNMRSLFKTLSLCFLFLFFVNQTEASQVFEKYLNSRGFFKSEDSPGYFQEHFINHKRKMMVYVTSEVLNDPISGWGLGSAMYNYYPIPESEQIYYDVVISRPSEDAILNARKGLYPGYVWQSVNPDRVAKESLKSFIYRNSLRKTPYGQIVAGYGQLELMRDFADNRFMRRSAEFMLENSPSAKFYPAARFLEDFDVYSNVFPHLSERFGNEGSQFLKSLTSKTLYAKPGNVKGAFLSVAYEFMMDSKVWKHDIYGPASGLSKKSIIRNAIKILRAR